ncbi:hypothetical protein CANTEDRAFT_106551 [Yamadazyma tenuis ATCC 10573]|uniref:Ataxin-10 homolog n=1 Tax=Candida tenuis (strain ATCC 10573 / BCRC 21748 / CBS 615 / JCM 9827 / NBRC 10315 / NRRL Y-1498 / VKM Y-70) TaxID=590646 RepID=G3B685_CANTC|nr:uncharacterized protein CANTEDRAFT_106551 [Yamadazyma tenuis ATCC 10573]EGV63410.1 hypothetical protein CANTEDRAFT_106551 [Yamadazyma tenuis ATCC 10573]
MVTQSISEPEIRVVLRSKTAKLQNLIIPASDDIQYLRLFRGVLLIIRNLVIETNDFEIETIATSLEQFQRVVPSSNEMYTKTVIVYYQIFANISQTKQPQCIHTLTKIMKFNDNTEHPVLVTLSNLFKNDQNIYDMLYNDYGIETMRHLTNFEVTEHPNEIERLYLEIWEKVVAHESFSKWIVKHDDEKVLKICQIVITSKDNWNNSQLLGILSWLFEMFKFLNGVAVASLNNKDLDSLGAVHPKLLMVLDCVSELSKFNIAKDFLINYEMVNLLIPLLRVVHESIEPKNMMKNKNQIIEFPHIKSIIIEILSYLTFENFKIQELIRELHGIEVILSSCVIDDSNPFMKERAIICLKYLLYKNAQNQEFVASLEAKKSVDSSLLEEAGYQVSINNSGKFELINGSRSR